MSEKRAKFARIPVAKLFVDQVNYQRDLKPKNVARITQGGWNERRAGALQVNEREDGRFAVYDGQHRLEAAKALGIAEVPCMVSSGMTIEQEAQAFISCNRDRQPPDWIDYLHAMVGAKDPEAIAILATIHRHKFRLSRAKGEPNVISAGKALSHSSDTYGLKALDTALGALRTAWDGDPTSLMGQFISAMARVLCDYREVIDEDRLVAVLSRVTPAEVLRLAKSLNPTFSASNESVARAFVTLYNKRLSSNRALSIETITNGVAARGTLKRWSKDQVRSGAANGVAGSQPIAAKAAR